MASKVYFTTFKTHGNENLMMKLQRLMKEAGFESMDLDKKYTAIKMHFGEYGNLSFLRPNYAKAVADYVKTQGGKPFLTDCNTLYVGSRKNALEHLRNAAMNGFNYETTGCDVIIADGLRGNTEALVPINCEYVKEAKIGKEIMEADAFISLTHFKFHEQTAIGGTLKNIGMGCGSRAGKMEMHCDGKPEVDQSLCIGCGACFDSCAHGAPIIKDGKCTIDESKCMGCGRCIAMCPMDAIHNEKWTSCKALNSRMAEYAYAVCNGRPHFHITLIMDCSPYCDCYALNDIPAIPDVGMLCSFDPVALDQCSADLCNEQPIMHGSIIDTDENHAHEHEHEGEGDRPHMIHPDVEWRTCLEHAEKIGLGTREYEMIVVE